MFEIVGEEEEEEVEEEEKIQTHTYIHIAHKYLCTKERKDASKAYSLERRSETCNVPGRPPNNRSQIISFSYWHEHFYESRSVDLSKQKSTAKMSR